MRKIIHIDMDCFYAAVEMRENPALKNIPMAVGGQATQRGVLTTANYIARQYGVHSAMPTAQALKLCPELKVIPGRMSFYKEVSTQIRAIFQRYTHIIEPLSLDEAYLDVTHTHLHQGSATRIAQEIRTTIENELDLTASAGIAPVKFLAKIASDINKPNNQYTIAPAQVADFIKALPLTKIPGVGKVTAQKLARLGLVNCLDVQQYDLGRLIKEFGKFGHILHERSFGIDPRPVNASRQRKSIGVERTLIKDIYDWSECLEVLERLYPELHNRLFHITPDLQISRQGVKFKFADFQATTQEHTAPILDKNTLFEIAHNTWTERRHNRGIRLVGLQVSLIENTHSSQLKLDLSLPENNPIDQ